MFAFSSFWRIFFEGGIFVRHTLFLHGYVAVHLQPKPASSQLCKEKASEADEFCILSNT
jgi:hypothetical protein